MWTGLSPRVRGNPSSGRSGRWASRSIPACAGEPRTLSGITDAFQVYPRVCGGTDDFPEQFQPHGGLSPRVRGNLKLRYADVQSWRSIPACAGEPIGAAVVCRAIQVYPRVCGGTWVERPGAGPRCGLSPRVRGNHCFCLMMVWCYRSIPACAGEPPRKTLTRSSTRVYPRVCGGTSWGDTKGRDSRGLSPRVRGNLFPPMGSYATFRSIPACAGEPKFDPSFGPCYAVYPRVCGGTVDGNRKKARKWGLSPRVRGNHQQASRPRRYRGSIPACAGEPRSAPFAILSEAVYPRVCGGTVLSRRICRSVRGLSPRVRGNRQGGVALWQAIRSIPACAGEPWLLISSAYPLPVYPRVCGGTALAKVRGDINAGLSPRVRGNPTKPRPVSRRARSIPACAGEPTDR